MHLFLSTKKSRYSIWRSELHERHKLLLKTGVDSFTGHPVYGAAHVVANVGVNMLEMCSGSSFVHYNTYNILSLRNYRDPPSLSVGLTSNQLSALSVLSSWWPDSRLQTGGRQYWQTLSSLLPVHSITAHWTACILHWLYHTTSMLSQNTYLLFVNC